ncbi:MAG: response regulator [Candidatus Melainabacteria bacterium]|nr:response regulator [Candidatus Melainabacteria bacterium]
MTGSMLIIDDDPRIREILEMSLEGEWMTMTASSGEEALHALQNMVPDVILSDRTLPDIDGTELILKIRENPNLKNVPVILLTARVQSQELEAYSKQDFAGVLSKPFDPMTLSDEINEILSGKF